MNRMLIAAFSILSFASSLCAQRTVRRLPFPVPPTLEGVTSFDSTYPFGAFPSYLESVPAPSPRPADPVPVSQLRIPSKALKEFERARKAFQSHELHSSAEHLRRAVQIYPDFIEAHNALGLRYVEIGEYQKALDEHKIALSLDPHNAQTHQNLSLALLVLDRFQEAEVEARQALNLDSRPAASRYFLGRALIGQNHITPEAIQMLHQSEQAFPNASLVLAQVHFTLGQTDQVVADLRQYLRGPTDPENKQKSECWAAQLSHQSVPPGCPAGISRPSFR